MSVHPDHCEPVVWSHPLPPGEARERWIQCVLDMVEIEKRDGESHMASHWVFCKKVLRERKEAVAIAGRFQRVALTREVVEAMADDWWEPTRWPSASDEERP